MSQWDPGNRSVFFFFLSLKCFPSNFLLFLFSFFSSLHFTKGLLSLFFCDIATVVSTTFHCLLDIYLECVISGTHNRAQGVVCVWSRLPSGSFLGGDHPLYASGTVTPERKGGNLFILFKVEQVWNFSSLSPSSYFNHFVRCLVCRRAYSNFSL